MAKSTTRWHRNILIGIIVSVVSSLVFASGASGGLLLDASLKGVYESNITGAASDIGKNGDYYTVLSASLGGYKGIGGNTFLFLRANTEGYIYRRYSDLDAAIIGMSGGIYKEFNNTFSAAGSIGIKKENFFKDSERNSTAYGGVINLKQQVYPRLWIKEGYEFEKNKADFDIFSYDAHLIGIWTGYSVMPKTTATLGYSYLHRTYEEPSGYRNIFHTFSFGLTREIIKKVSVTGSYDRQYISANLPGANHIDNIFALGLSYSY